MFHPHRFHHRQRPALHPSGNLIPSSEAAWSSCRSGRRRFRRAGISELYRHTRCRDSYLQIALLFWAPFGPSQARAKSAPAHRSGTSAFCRWTSQHTDLHSSNFSCSTCPPCDRFPFAFWRLWRRLPETWCPSCHLGFFSQHARFSLCYLPAPGWASRPSSRRSLGHPPRTTVHQWFCLGWLAWRTRCRS